MLRMRERDREGRKYRRAGDFAMNNPCIFLPFALLDEHLQRALQQLQKNHFFLKERAFIKQWRIVDMGSQALPSFFIP